MGFVKDNYVTSLSGWSMVKFASCFKVVRTNYWLFYLEFLIFSGNTLYAAIMNLIPFFNSAKRINEKKPVVEGRPG